MTRFHLGVAGALLIGLGSAPALEAHNATQAVLAFEEPGPVAGAPAVVLIQFEPPEGIDEELKDGEVRLVAEMTGHAMPPVEVLLQLTEVPGRYRGELVFSMAGPWRIRLRAQGLHGTTIGTTGVEVAREPGAPLPRSLMALIVLPSENASADPPLPYSPWTILFVALGLTAALEAVAVVRKLVVTRRRQAVASR